MRNVSLILLFVALNIHAIAQTPALVYDNKVYQPNIQSVECYNTKKEQSFPIIALRSNETLTVAFDDLKGGSKVYRYTLVHCTFDWKPSRINSIDYLESFNEDIITNYRFSFNTLQKFTNYRFTFPNNQIKPKISGNYLLIIYEGNNPNQVVISQRFYISDNSVNIAPEVVASTAISNFKTKHKINFSIFHESPIVNPYLNLKAVIMQNGIPHSAITNTKPNFIQQKALVYNELNANEFWAGNEFRKFDTRSFRYKAAHVQDFFRDSSINVILFTDQANKSTKYSNQFDENGNFFIRNQDGRDNITDSDYANVLFTLSATPPTAKGNAYVLGRFNNYSLNEDSKLIYDQNRGKFFGNIKLKQGLYDFKYVWVDETRNFNDTVFEGSFFEAENNYQILVYYRKPGARWDELIGFNQFNSIRR